jgi:drug/metabolite transporter (DMT)-like permease
VAAVLLACLAAACFGALAVSIRIGLSRRAEPELAPLVTSAGGFLLVAAVAVLSGELGRSAAADLWPFVAIGAAVPGLSQLLFVRAIRDAGPSRAAVLIGTAPIISAILAVAFLGETLGPALGVATLLIVAGGTALAWEPARPASFKTIGAVLALACAVAFAVRDNLVRAATTDLDAPPLAATAASLAGATVALAIVLLLFRRDSLLDGRRLVATIVPFAPAAVLLGAAYAALVEAFARGDVTVVAPLNATQSLWAVVLAATLLTRTEMIGRRLVLAAVLIVAGSVLVGATR